MKAIGKAILVLACLLAGGCFEFGLSPRCAQGADPHACEYDHLDHFDTQRAAREDPGPTLIAGSSGRFAYTRDGAEILYTVRSEALGSWIIRRTTLADGSGQDVTDLPMAEDLFALTPDGEGLYYPAYDPLDPHGLFVLRAAFTRSDVDLGGWEPHDVVASADSAWLLVSASKGRGDLSQGAILEGAILAVERATGALVPTACGSVIGAVFSPAGDEILCRRWNADYSTTTVRFGLQDGATRELPGIEHGDCLSSWWGGGEIRTACWSFGRVVVGDPETGTVVAAIEIGDGGAVGPFSPDGSALAFVSSECLEGYRYKGSAVVSLCSRRESQLKVLDVATQRVSVIASSGGGLEPSVAFGPAMAFSADGKTLTYTVGGDIHARPSGL